MRINLKGHAKRRFDERFPDESYDILIHQFKTGKLVRRPEKEGSVGKVVKRTKKGKICFKFIVRCGEIWIITIEG
jgi:hypothetical protein